MLATGEVIWEDGLITSGEKYLATQIIKDRGLGVFISFSWCACGLKGCKTIVLSSGAIERFHSRG